MNVEIHLFDQLTNRLPDAPRGRAPLELPDAASLADLLAYLDIPGPDAKNVLVNGRPAPRDPVARAAMILMDDDVVSIAPTA